MSAKILDGKKTAAEARQLCRDYLNKKGIMPVLVIVTIGDDPASAVYVRNKIKACEECGIYVRHEKFAADADPDMVERCIMSANIIPEVAGIMIQLPVPDGWDARKLMELIDPEKDVDGLTYANIGMLWSGEAMHYPCTAKGIDWLLHENGIHFTGKHVVVVGRSDIVGKPMAAIALENNATVTICHSRTKNLAEHTRMADILIVAVGKPGLITGDMVKPGAVVVDVGINRTENGLVGDVDFESVAEVASWITPVPGGVGPMTVAMLMNNVARALAFMED
jgi:methylenetetrahydrofolate dehydrogenase (NADP+)/methenyltetrahydrofolate cyclohydrolase